MRYLIKIICFYCYKILSACFPFQMQLLLDKIYATKIGVTVCPVLGKSYDYPDNIRLLWRQAFLADFSIQRFKRIPQMEFVSQKNLSEVVYLDITRLYYHDIRTGIQRRIKEQTAYLLADEDFSNRCRVIYFDSQYKSYFYATKFLQKYHPDNMFANDDSPVVFHSYDILLIMECFLPYRVPLKYIHKNDIIIASVIDDILPLEHKEWVAHTAGFKQCFEKLVRYSSAIVSDSQTALDSIRLYVEQNKLYTSSQLNYFYCYCGSDFQKTSKKKLSLEETVMLNSVQYHQYVLSVSTLEPRKGYLQAVQAFEKLWDVGEDLSFVIVGKQGWNVDELADYIEQHKLYGKKLFWFQGISDVLLKELYRNSLFVLNASEGEGFGLMSMEAAFYEKAILARDIPVFRELLKDQVMYFPDNRDASTLAEAITKCKIAIVEGKLSTPENKIAYISWQESAQMLKTILVSLLLNGDKNESCISS